MTGVKGRSGGKRAGAGRKANAAVKMTELLKIEAGPVRPESSAALRDDLNFPALPGDSPLAFLEAVMKDPRVDLKTRVRSAIAAAQYRHLKKGDGGKKDEVADKAKVAATGRFAPKAPPKLVITNK